MNTTIRLARKTDIPPITDILNHEILHSTAIYDYEPRTVDYQLEWYDQKLKDQMPIIIVEGEGEVLGFGTFGIFRPKVAYRFSVEHSIYVKHTARSKGIGKLLMVELIKLAKKDGYHTMIAGIDALNKGSYEFHQKFGFKEVGRFKEVGYKFNQWLDLIFMELLLDT